MLSRACNPKKTHGRDSRNPGTSHLQVQDQIEMSERPGAPVAEN